MDARLRNGLLVWTSQDAGESRASMIERTWFLTNGCRHGETLARCAVAVSHLGCKYDDAVMRASSCTRKMYVQDNQSHDSHH